MPKRDWLGNTTLALVALATLVFMVAVCTAIIFSEYAKVHDANSAYQKNAEADRRAASQKIADACQDRTGDAFRACIAEHVDAYYSEQATNEDLQAQQDMAFWAAALFISSTVLTSIGIGLLYLTLSATRQTLVEAGKTTAAAEATIATTQRIGEAQVRAYLSCTGATYRIVNRHCSVTVTLKNFGQSPAKHAALLGRLITYDMDGSGDADGFLRLEYKTAEFFDLPAAGEDDQTLMLDVAFSQDIRGELTEGIRPVLVECELHWWDVFKEQQTIRFFLIEQDSDFVQEADFPRRREGTMKASNSRPNTQEEGG